MSSTLIVNNEWLGRDFIVTALDLRNLKLPETGRAICLKGIRKACEVYGVEYQDLRNNGVAASFMVATGDLRLQRAVLMLYRKGV